MVGMMHAGTSKKKSDDGEQPNVADITSMAPIY